MTSAPLVPAPVTVRVPAKVNLELLVGPDDCIMNQLKDCHLYVCGYDNTTAQMNWFKIRQMERDSERDDGGDDEMVIRIAAPDDQADTRP